MTPLHHTVKRAAPNEPGEDGEDVQLRRSIEASMKITRNAFCSLALCAAAVVNVRAGDQLGNVLDRLGKVTGKGGLSDDRIVSGLKEALQVGAANAIGITGKTDGFYRNAAIKILLPEKIRTLEKGLRLAGIGPKVDEFEMSMNRAAEKSVPLAKSIFLGAIREMTLEDGRKILAGGDTAATTYFRTKTSATLTSAFKPIVRSGMEEAGVTRQYKQLLGGLPQLPFMKKDAFDLDDYVVSKSLDGLFQVLGDEERKIRTDPAARVTSLLKDVFGK